MEKNTKLRSKDAELSPKYDDDGIILQRKKLSALLRGITSKSYDGFYCSNFLHSFITKNKIESHKRVYKKKLFCNVIMPSGDTKILEFNLMKHHLLFVEILNVYWKGLMHVKIS